MELLPREKISKGDLRPRWAILKSIEEYERFINDDTEHPHIIKGTLLHVGLAHFYKRKMAEQNGENPDNWYKPIIAMKIHAEQNGWVEHIEPCIQTLLHYIKHWEKEDIKILDVEIDTWTQIAWWQVTARFDLLIEDKHGKIWIVDHKTTSNLRDNAIAYYSSQPQLLAYAYLGQEFYKEKFGGVIVNILQHPTPKFLRAELQQPKEEIAKIPEMVDVAHTMMINYDMRIC